MKKYIKLLTVITNCFIIAGVTRHWIRYDNTKLAAPQQKPPKYKKKPRMVQAAKKRTKMLIKKLTHSQS